MERYIINLFVLNQLLIYFSICLHFTLILYSKQSGSVTLLHGVGPNSQNTLDFICIIKIINGSCSKHYLDYYIFFFFLWSNVFAGIFQNIFSFISQFNKFTELSVKVLLSRVLSAEIGKS